MPVPLRMLVGHHLSLVIVTLVSWRPVNKVYQLTQFEVSTEGEGSKLQFDQRAVSDVERLLTLI